MTAPDTHLLRLDGFQRAAGMVDLDGLSNRLGPGGAEGLRSAKPVEDELIQVAQQPRLLAFVRSILGGRAEVSETRLLTDDDFRGVGAAPRQDWAYGCAGVRELGVLAPLTALDGVCGPGFFAGSHRHGPLSRGPLDPSRFPPMRVVMVKAEPGDVLIYDPLAWRLGAAPARSRLPLIAQFVYREKTMAGGAGGVTLQSRFDASNVPSVEFNAQEAQRRLRRGDREGAARFARGLTLDDPDHVGAALVLHDALAAMGDGGADVHLENARASVARLAVEVAVRAARADAKAGRPPSGSNWSPLQTAWWSTIEGHPHAGTLPATFCTPSLPWSYGAVSDLLPIDGPAALQLKVSAQQGRVGFCLVNDDQTQLLSDQQFVGPELGETRVFLAFDPRRGPARLCLRNFNDPGVAGRVELISVTHRAVLNL